LLDVGWRATSERASWEGPAGAASLYKTDPHPTSARRGRWERRLLPEVTAAAPPGDACPLFWPPPGAAAAAEGDGDGDGGGSGGGAGPYGRPHPLAAGAERAASQLQAAALKVGPPPARP
jgi:hypothetical protein